MRKLRLRENDLGHSANWLDLEPTTADLLCWLWYFCISYESWKKLNCIYFILEYFTWSCEKGTEEVVHILWRSFLLLGAGGMWYKEEKFFEKKSRNTFKELYIISTWKIQSTLAISRTTWAHPEKDSWRRWMLTSVFKGWENMPYGRMQCTNA